MEKFKFSVDLSAVFELKKVYKVDNSPFSHATIQVRWDNVTGTLNGVFKTYGTLDPGSENWTLLDSVVVSSADNVADLHTLIVTANFTALWFDYVPNDITAGDMTVNVLMRD